MLCLTLWNEKNISNRAGDLFWRVNQGTTKRTTMKMHVSIEGADTSRSKYEKEDKKNETT